MPKACYFITSIIIIPILLLYLIITQSWEEPIKRDIEEMKKPQVQPPLSSAYLEAGPIKKRKVSDYI